jgi:hypothetical protein
MVVQDRAGLVATTLIAIVTCRLRSADVHNEIADMCARSFTKFSSRHGVRWPG